MIELARALLALAIAIGVGTLLDRVLRFAPRSAAKWPLRGLAALVALYLAQVLPVLLGVLVVGAFLMRPKQLPGASRKDRVAILGVGALVILVMARLPTTLYWDEMVWLAKARIEAASPGALTPEALRVGTSTIPPGYPNFVPLSVAALAGYGTATRSLVFGAELLTILSASVLYLLAPRRIALLACTPLVLVHLRSSYVDLELGMLAAGLFLLLDARETRAAVVVALAMVAMKDEGLAHVLAVSAVVVVSKRRPAGLVVAGIAYAAFAGWRSRLTSSGVVDSDHLLGKPLLKRIPEILHHVLVAASDALGWGFLWAAVGGMIVAGVLRPSRMTAATRVRCAVLGVQAALLFGGLLSSPDRVMEFMRSGTLLPRLLIQLAPMAMLALASSLSERG